MKFRLIVNSAKRHFKWVEEQCGINGAQLWVLWEINLPRNALSSLDKLLERVLHEMGPTEKDSMNKPLAELSTGK